MERVFILDGTRISSLESFYDEVGRVLLPGLKWGQNLDAFDEILGGGWGTPAEGFTIRWDSSAILRVNLGHPETVRQLTLMMQRCHPSNKERLRNDLALATSGQGPTVFDWLVETIRDLGPGGASAEDNVLLVLA